MWSPPKTIATNRLDSDPDAAALLRNLAKVILVACCVLVVTLLLLGKGMRPSVLLAGLVAVVMLALARQGRATAAAYILCWGLLVPAGTAISMFGFRSTGVLLIPLVIMSGGWLLGRRPAFMLAIAGCSLSIFGYLHHVNNPTSPMPQVTVADVLSHFAVFLVAAMLASAMVATLRRQYDQVSTLAAGLQQANATLEDRISERTEQLVTMQQKVMDTEKLTSLGSLVAGISHELNTPLGNALTVSTSLEARVQDLKLLVESGKLSRSDMSEFLANAAAMAQLTSRSVTRAADLVAGFKQVAVAQNSEMRRNFQLNDVLADIIAALRPSLALAEVTVNVADGITCDTYPGPFGQVVTNLVQNAVVHGLEGQLNGRVEITALVQGDQVLLEVSDNGLGMEPKVLARVFEPFFTTRLGKGRSGLGLTLAHRIATSVLAGSLSVRSEPGQGSTFTLIFPMRQPGAI